MKTKLYAALIASSALFSVSAAQAAPVIYDNETDFNTALGGITLSVEDFEGLAEDNPSPYDFGDFVATSGLDIQASLTHGTNGPRTLRISEHEDFYVTFTFDSPIQAFSIDAVDALDSGGGDFDITIDGNTYNFLDDVSLPNENVLFIGIIDLDGFTSVTLDGSDSGDKIYYDNLQYGGTPTEESSGSESTAVAEPGTLAVMGLSLAGLGFARRRRNA